METNKWPKHGKRNAMRVSGFSVGVRHALLDGALYIAFVESGALVYCASPFFRNLAFVSAIRVTLCNCYFLVSECCVAPFGNISVVWCCQGIWPNIFVQFWERVASVFPDFFWQPRAYQFRMPVWQSVFSRFVFGVVKTNLITYNLQRDGHVCAHLGCRTIGGFGAAWLDNLWLWEDAGHSYRRHTNAKKFVNGGVDWKMAAVQVKT